MSVAVQSILAGMPEPSDLRCTEHEGTTLVTVGSRVIAGFDTADTGMRNITIVTLTDLGFTGRRVAEAFGVTPEHVSTVRSRAHRLGSAGLVRPRGRRAKLSTADVRKARALRAQGLSDVRIGHLLAVTDKTVARVLKAVDGAVTTSDQAQTEVDLYAQPEPEPQSQPEGEPEPEPQSQPELQPEDVQARVAGSGGSARIAHGRFSSRYAGAMLLHAFTDRVHASDVFASVATPTPGCRFDDVTVLTGVSMLFALGFKAMEQAKHPDRVQVGPLAGISVLPELRTLRPRLAAIADGCDPLALQRTFATAMLTADPCTSGVYYVDEHFMPYTGALPVGKGWNTKRRHAEPGRVDTVVADARGRAVCFTTGEPSGLSTSLPATLAELRAITGEAAKITLGFDRGGAYPSVFTTCRQHHVDWITYRRGTLITPTVLPIHATITRGGKPITITYTDETVTINDYGQCRQITLFEAGKPVLQILTSDTLSCPAALIAFMRARWRIENLFKYLDFYGIDYLADYTATIQTNTRPVDNPARTAARDQLHLLTEERDALHGLIGALHTDPTISVAELNRRSLVAQRKIHHLDKKITAAEQELKTIPAKLPANHIDPDAQRAIHRTTRRGLQMVLRLLAANAEHWLAHHLNAYLQDPYEYRATTRNLLHLAGTITYTSTTIHVELDPPNTRRLTRALTLLLQEINTTPPRIPGDPRPITYTITTT
jgi:hypothetical protein